MIERSNQNDYAPIPNNSQRNTKRQCHRTDFEQLKPRQSLYSIKRANRLKSLRRINKNSFQNDDPNISSLILQVDQIKMYGSNLPSATTTINIEMISPKQLIGECLDLAAVMLKEVIEVYCNNNKIEMPFSQQKCDFSTCVNYILDASRFDKIIQNFIKQDIISNKAFLRTWLYELKSIRNAWAHWSPDSLDYRLSNRAYDTLSLIFMGFKGNPQSNLFQKIEFYRKKLLIATAKNYHFAEQQQMGNM